MVLLGGLNAIVHVDPVTEKVRVFSLPAGVAPGGPNPKLIVV